MSRPSGSRRRSAQAGIEFKKGEQIELIDTRTGEIDLAHAPDEIQFEVEAIQQAVVTDALQSGRRRGIGHATSIRTFPGKTLIFAATDAHADIVVDEIKKAFRDDLRRD